MKIRSGFISNSSSSSFLISYKVNPETEEVWNTNFRAKLEDKLMKRYNVDDGTSVGGLLRCLIPSLAKRWWAHWFHADREDEDGDGFERSVYRSREDIDKDKYLDFDNLSDEEKAFFDRAFELGREVRFTLVPDSGDGGDELDTAIRNAGSTMNLRSDEIDILFMKEW